MKLTALMNDLNGHHAVLARTLRMYMSSSMKSEACVMPIYCTAVSCSVEEVVSAQTPDADNDPGDGLFDIATHNLIHTPYRRHSPTAPCMEERNEKLICTNGLRKPYWEATTVDGDRHPEYYLSSRRLPIPFLHAWCRRIMSSTWSTDEIASDDVGQLLTMRVVVGTSSAVSDGMIYAVQYMGVTQASFFILNDMDMRNVRSIHNMGTGQFVH
ncbi:hypothetical protein N7535_008564 [Penicillium sp. DV-2018c]|nr:hypothetical protein N7461_002324 [Penicillium sp. DV-2018c]KAJ5563400.1 hypothetical protein N7535_008564 [Penicillium sp. DV-2018c]